MKSRIILCYLILTLSACGFHLRGTQQKASVDVAKVYVVSERANMVTKEVKEQLRAAGSASVTSVEEGRYTLTVYREDIEQIVLSASAATVKVVEYQLILTVSMSVSDANGKSVLSGENIRLTRDYTFDENAVLGKVAEENLLREELARQAASQILRRLQTATSGN